MAISPISSVSFKSNYNVGFTSRRKNDNSYSTSPVKAIPLAVLLAMSPVAGSYGQKKQATDLEIKVYPKVLTDDRYKEKNLTVKYVDSDGDLSTIEYVNFASEYAFGKMMNKEPLTRYDIYGTVKSLTDYNFNIIGDDGNELGTLGYSQVILDDNREVSLPQVVEDIRKFAISNRNRAFKINNVSADLIPSRERGLITRLEGLTKFDTSWKNKIKNKSYNFGTKIMSGDVKTQMGNYRIDFYSSDNNNSNYEAIVMERSDGLKFKLDGTTQLDLMFATADGNRDEKITLGMINISWPGVGEYSIFDDELYTLIDELAKDKKFNKAFHSNIIDRQVVVTSDGIISTYKINNRKLM